MLSTAQQNTLLQANNFTKEQRAEAEAFMLSIAPMFDTRFLKYYSNTGWIIPDVF